MATVAGQDGQANAGVRACDTLPAFLPVQSKKPVRRTPENTLVFDHERLTAASSGLYVLQVDDGGYFQVLFTCTAPQFFNYTISGDADAQPDSASGTVLPESVSVTIPLTTRGITMRHDARFLRYRVSARLRSGLVQPAGAQTPGRTGTTGAPVNPPILNQPPEAGPPDAGKRPELYSVAFDIWVITKPEWKLGVIGGVAASGLTDPRYFIKIDDAGKKTFEQDDRPDQIHTDVMALAHAYYTRTYGRLANFGLAFGIGTSGTTPRFFLGPSVTLGKYFVFNPGVAIGSVAQPPIGQKTGQPPINGDNTLNSLSTRTVVSPYFGVGFTWIERTDQFSAALTSASSASGVVGSCVASVSPATVTFDEEGKASSPITVTAGADCLWAATLQNGGTAFQIANGSAKGNGTIAVNTTGAGAVARKGVLNVVGPMGSAAKAVSLVQPPKSCVQSVAQIVNGQSTAVTDPIAFTSDATLSFQVLTEPDPAKPDACQVSVTTTPDQTFTIARPSPTAFSIKPPPAADTDTTATLTIAGPPDAKAQTFKLVRTKKASDNAGSGGAGGVAASCVTGVTDVFGGPVSGELKLDGSGSATPLTIAAGDGCAWTAVLPADAPSGFKVTPGAGTGKGSILLEAPPAGNADAKARLSIAGPSGSTLLMISIVQPKKPWQD